ncbi:hypothetical protein [Hyalangium rubrum]|uniref:Uncharacterized protein n=1 Tax=Hyalangium rubrum TaxID=3103134 RepID=A0ABU5GYD3_9BACT|nr:hypothetical protein [Hyalangium sp. s54d21]MDY7224845.1 hypothetical protein [Hyalangium sp. s54d21]
MATALPPTLPMDLRRDAERIFDLSLWCLGRDVLCPEGNLLLRRGLTRERPPGEQGHSVYTVPLPGGGILKLWGFGVLWDAGAEAVYLARDGFTPRMVDVASVSWPVFQVEGLGAMNEPRTFEARRDTRVAVVTMAEWFARHEEWVATHVGHAWREACFAERRKAPPVHADELAAAWWRLAVRVRALEFVVNDCTAPTVGA